MKSSSLVGLTALLMGLLVGACAPTATRIDSPLDIPAEIPVAPTTDPHYQPIIQRGPEYIDALRAQPAPEQPEVVEGESDLGDQRELASQGFVRIGNGRYAQADADTMEQAVELGQSIGADRMVLYPHHRAAQSEAESGQFLVAYYVRFKLLFGATFRNLTASERSRLGLENGVQIGSVVGGTPASQANLMAGDYILAFNGKPIEDRIAFQKLLLDAAGKPVNLRVLRGKQAMNRVIRLGAPPAPVDTSR